MNDRRHLNRERQRRAELARILERFGTNIMDVSIAADLALVFDHIIVVGEGVAVIGEQIIDEAIADGVVPPDLREFSFKFQRANDHRIAYVWGFGDG